MIDSPTASDIGRELARRLRSGPLDAETIEAAAFSLESLATLYERSQGVLVKALDSRGHLRPMGDVTPERK